MKRMARLATTVVVSGGIGLAGLGLATGTAQVDPIWGPSYEGGNCPEGVTCTHWCPGDSLIPGNQVITWDWNICHDWYWDSEGTVDVATNIVYPWHGVTHEAVPPPAVGPAPPPAPWQPLPPDCPPWSPILAPTRCGGL